MRLGVDFGRVSGEMVSFRQNVAALMVDAAGRLLVCERWNIPGAWQFPQGGVDAGEEAQDALFREVREEVGLLPEHYEVVERRGGYRYMYPPEVRLRKLRKHGNHGQEQTYFRCLLRADAPPVNVEQQPREFGDFRWIAPEEFRLGWLPEFKREVYRQVLRDFFAVEV